MLAIRLQRTGRTGHSQFRLIAQDSRFSPKRGRVVAYLGSYNPHTKEAKFDSEKISQYLSNGAQPSDSAAKLLQKEGVKIPAWVKLAEPRQRTVRNPEKRRSTRPVETAPAETMPTEAEAPADLTEPTSVEPDQPAESAPAEAETQTAEPEVPAEAKAKPATGAGETVAEPQSPAEEA